MRRSAGGDGGWGKGGKAEPPNTAVQLVRQLVQGLKLGGLCYILKDTTRVHQSSELWQEILRLLLNYHILLNYLHFSVLLLVKLDSSLMWKSRSAIWQLSKVTSGLCRAEFEAAVTESDLLETPFVSNEALFLKTFRAVASTSGVFQTYFWTKRLTV